jgi:hypothetical protein
MKRRSFTSSRFSAARLLRGRSRRAQGFDRELAFGHHGAIRLASKVRGIGYTTRCKMLYSDKSS